MSDETGKQCLIAAANWIALTNKPVYKPLSNFVLLTRQVKARAHESDTICSVSTPDPIRNGNIPLRPIFATNNQTNPIQAQPPNGLTTKPSKKPSTPGRGLSREHETSTTDLLSATPLPRVPHRPPHGVSFSPNETKNTEPAGRLSDNECTGTPQGIRTLPGKVSCTLRTKSC